MAGIENEKREDIVDAGNLGSKSRSLTPNIHDGKQVETNSTIDQPNPSIIKKAQTQLKILKQFIFKKQDEKK